MAIQILVPYAGAVVRRPVGVRAMTQTIFACFVDSAKAQRAIVDLCSLGVPPDEISLIMQDASGNTASYVPDRPEREEPLSDSVPIVLAGNDGTGNRFDPL